MEIPASSLKLRANAPKGRKQFPIRKVMRMAIATDRCQGHNRCCLVPPELFEADDGSNAHVHGDGTVPAGLEAKASLAVANCPEHAIRLTGA